MRLGQRTYSRPYTLRLHNTCCRDSAFESVRQLLRRRNQSATRVLLICGPARIARLIQSMSNKHTTRNESNRVVVTEKTHSLPQRRERPTSTCVGDHCLIVRPYLYAPICSPLFVRPYLYAPICSPLFVRPYLYAHTNHCNTTHAFGTPCPIQGCN